TLFAYLRQQQKATPANPAHLLALGDPAFTPTDKPRDLPAPPDHGIPITVVQPRSPADRAGLKPRDVLLRYDGTKLTSLDDLRAALASAAGKTPRPESVPVSVWREGETVECQVASGPLGIGVSKQPAADAIRSTREAEAVLRQARGEGFQ